VNARFHLSLCVADLESTRAFYESAWKMIVADPSGNAIELKCYRDESEIFNPR
jgi:extradiol dioxygenase family protein